VLFAVEDSKILFLWMKTDYSTFFVSGPAVSDRIKI